MERFFTVRDWWGNGLTLWVVVLLLFSAPLLVITLRDVSLENDITTWLPSDDPDAQSLDWFSNEFEKENRIIASWDSSTLNDPRMERLSAALQRTGVHEIAGIAAVTTPQDLIQLMVNNKVDQTDAIRRLTGVLVGRGFLKVELSEEFDWDSPSADDQQVIEEIRRLVSKQLKKPVTVLPPVKEILEPSIQLAGTDELIEQLYPHLPRHHFQLRWPEMSASAIQLDTLESALSTVRRDGQPAVRRVFFAPGAPVAMTVTLDDASDDFLAETIADIELAAQNVGIPAEELHLAGSPVSRVRLSQEAGRAVWNRDYPAWNLYKRTPILLSAVVGILVSFLLLRSKRLAFLVSMSSIWVCLAVISLIPATGKSLNMVLIVLPDLLLVLTTSGAIHLANYWKHAVTLGVPHPVAHAVRMAARPCFLASTTTAVGMASLLTAVLEPVREFGFYASIGCLISLAMILFGFPSMMAVWPGKPKKFAEHTQQEATIWGHFGRWIVRHGTAISCTCCLVFVVAVCGLKWFKTETKVIRYFPEDSAISQDYRFLEDSLAGIVSVDTVVRFDQDAVDTLNISERLELVRNVERHLQQHRWVSGTISLADFRDPVPPPSEKASTFQKIRYGKTLQRIESGIFAEQTETTSQFARKASRPLTLTTPTGRQINLQAGEEIWRIRAQSIITADVNYSRLTGELETIVADAISGTAGTEYLVTGMVPLFLRTQQAVLESLINSFGLAFLIIAIVMMILLRSPLSGFLAMLPNLFPVGVVFGFVAWMGIPVDIGTMITASVALGIAIDGTLHLLTWYRDGIRQGMSREDSIVLALQHCGPAMWQTSATIALGIVMVSGADLLLISRFGLLMSGLVVVAMIADIILLPALLSGWLGQIIARNTPVTAITTQLVDDAMEFSEDSHEPQPMPDDALQTTSARSSS